MTHYALGAAVAAFTGFALIVLAILGAVIVAVLTS